MFKSLQLKLVTIFVLLVLAIMTVAGTFLVLRVCTGDFNLFQDGLGNIFTSEIILVLLQIIFCLLLV